MLRPRFSPTNTPTNVNIGMATYYPSKLEVFLNTTITGISLIIAFGVYIYLFAILALVFLVPHEHASLALATTYGNNNTINDNIDRAAFPLIEMFFPHSNSKLMIGAKSVLQAHQQRRQRPTSLGHGSENGNTGSQIADIKGSDGASKASSETLVELSGGIDNGIDIPKFVPLPDAEYSWWTEQDHHALGKYAGVHVLKNDQYTNSHGESEGMGQSADTVSDNVASDSNYHDKTTS
jgi:hypothetical protein